MSNFNDNLIKKWRERFDICVRLTLAVPMGLTALQIAFVGNQLSFDITKLSTWTNVEEVFALPLGVLALLAAITSLIGLYHRSMLLNRQLEKVQEQISISNKQSAKSNEQFKVSQEQLRLNQKKENFNLYIEHKKLVIGIIKEKLELCKMINPRFTDDGLVDAIYIDEIIAYKFFYPDNSPIKMKIFDCDFTNTSSSLDTKLLIETIEKIAVKQIEKISIIPFWGGLEELAKTGFTFRLEMYNSAAGIAGGEWQVSFFRDLHRVFLVLSKLDVFDEDVSSTLLRESAHLRHRARELHKTDLVIPKTL